MYKDSWELTELNFSIGLISRTRSAVAPSKLSYTASISSLIVRWRTGVIINVFGVSAVILGADDLSSRTVYYRLTKLIFP